MAVPEPRFFTTPAAFRRWLTANHASAAELIVGFYKKNSGRVGITYPDALDEALCFGWIDGVRHRRDAESYTIRFTPRKPRSRWSAVNVRHARRLAEAGRMRPVGLAAFEAREGDRAGYAYESRPARFAPAHTRQFRAERAAWAFFEAQPPGYRRTATFWVESAKQEETRLRRLTSLIEFSASGRRLPMLAPPGRPAKKR